MRQVADGTYYRNGIPVTQTSGYAVGLAKGDAFATLSENHTLFGFCTILEDYPKAQCVGVWSEKLGLSTMPIHGTKIVFDPIVLIEDLSHALRLAKRNQQKAIWCFASGKEIFTLL